MDMLRFIADHMPKEKGNMLLEVLNRDGASAVRLRYRPYDWSVNDTK